MKGFTLVDSWMSLIKLRKKDIAKVKAILKSVELNEELVKLR